MATGRTIFTLLGKVALDGADKSTSDLQALDKQGEKTDSKMSKFGKTMGKVGKGVAKAGTIIVAGAAAMAKLTTNTANQLDEIDKMSQKIGISSKAYQEWDFILSQNGASVSGLQMGVKTMSTAIHEAGKGTKSYVDDLTALGLSYEELNGLSQEEQFNKVFGALANVEDESKRTALASKLLGRSATELAPAFNAGSEAIEAQRKQSHELGLVLEDDLVKSGAKTVDMIDQLKRTFSAGLNKAMAQALPIIMQIIESLLPLIPVLLDLIAPLAGLLLPILKNLISDFLPPLIEIIKSIMVVATPILERVIPILVNFLVGFMEMMFPIIEEILPIIEPLLMAIFEVITPLLEVLMVVMEAVLPILPDLIKMISEAVIPLIMLIVDLLDLIMPILVPAIKFLADIFGKYLKNALDTIMPIVTGIINIFKGVIDFIKNIFAGDWSAAWESIVGVFKGIWDTMVAIFKAPINWIIGLLNIFIGALNKIKIPDWVPGLGGKGISINPIQKLAKGVDFWEGGQAIVGDDPKTGEGGELVTLPRGTRVDTAADTAKMRGNTINIYANDTSPYGIVRAQRRKERLAALGV